MSNPVASYSQNLYLGEPPAGSADYDRDLKQNFRIMDFINQGKNNFTRSGLVVSAGSGLTVNWTSGAAEINSVPYTIGSGSGSATNNTSDPNIQLANYVFINNSGVITISTSLPTTEYTPLALIFTNAGLISKVVDCRKIAVGSSDSPSFATIKLSNLTDGYIPKHTSDAVGLANSPIYTDGTNVGVGIGVPLHSLHIYKPVADNWLNIESDTNYSAGIILYKGSIKWYLYNIDYASNMFYIQSAAGNQIIVKQTGEVGIGMIPTVQLQLSTDGAKKLSTTTWATGSDIRIKKNIIPADLQRCYEIIKNLPLIHHGWDDGYLPAEHKDRSQLGWLAQDAEKVFPKAVEAHKLEYCQKIDSGEVEEYEEQDENGIMVKKTRPVMKPIKTIEDCKSLNADQIFKAMYGALQLLIQKVEILEGGIYGWK